MKTQTPSPAILLQGLQDQGIAVTLAGDRLKIEAPRKGMITPELCEQLAQRKAELIAHLSAPPITDLPATPNGSICQCQRSATCYSDQGDPFCEDCRNQALRTQRAVSPALVRVTSAPFFLQDVAGIIEWTQTYQSLVVDLETTGMHEHLDRVVAITLGRPGKVAVIDMRPYYNLPLEEQALWREVLHYLFHLDGITWIGHNLKFDWKFLAAHFQVHLPRVYDTMLAEQLIHGVGLNRAGMRESAARYRLPVSKEARAWFPGLHTRPTEWVAPFPAEQLVYMVQDIEIPYAIAQHQRPRIKELKLARVVHLENEAVPALAAMEMRGVCIDVERWRSILARKQARQQALEPELRETLGIALQRACDDYQAALTQEEKRLVEAYRANPAQSSWEPFRRKGLAQWQATHKKPPQPKERGTINLASPPQLLAALRALGVPVTATDEETLEPYTKEHTAVASLLQWKELHKFASSFGENLLAMIDTDGRLRTDYAQIGAVSGRIICSKPNLQQIPAEEEEEGQEEPVRRCFVASPGYRILKADLSNIELRILAEVSRDQTMLRLFAEGKDLHAETAKLMFHLSPETDTKKHLYKGVPVRKIAKTINFGLAYGMGANGLANRAGVDLPTAKSLIRTYFETYRGIARWLPLTAKQALEQGYAVTLAGRRRTFGSIPTSVDWSREVRASAERSAKNHPIQGTNADILKRALALLHASLPPGAHLILAVHDEIVVECPESCMAEAEQAMKEVMVQACRDFLKVVHIPAPEVLIDTYWRKE
ncbi:DNA polymerase [Ktedonobacter sp. SOSP1-85]|uniref:DNA polymerase n=1 Tax=Ktedonobacter sp. SOSP1-85 TaxID=2778367 RepID=UPI0019160610|nr:DNA polymerase [Ktedonobacter sp. SOSP1-85]